VFDLTGRVVLVTGASRGIGRAIALELGRAGADVVVHYHVSRYAAETVRAELARAGAAATVVAGDMESWEDAGKLVAAAGKWKERLDGLVASAGVYAGEPTDQVGPKGFDRVIRTDLQGPFRTVQAALPFLRRSVRPSVVLVSSVLGAHAGVGAVPYQAAKAGVEQMTRALALELSPRIRVNAVAPGFIRTDMNRDAHTDPAVREAVARATPLGRWGDPEDVAPAVRYLLSLEADWVTGSVLGVDGGIPLV
jgi:NAD(P)-dependent dehydrogenase (short-subunit alcohol dehydrogenase family)